MESVCHPKRGERFERVFLTPYQLVYLDQNGRREANTPPVNLVAGWNAVTVTANGTTVTFFVYGT